MTSASGGNTRAVLILCDFDGTVTERDTNSFLAEQFAPSAYREVEHKLASRELTLREVLGAELGAMTAGQEAIVAAAVSAIPFRAGFRQFVDHVRARGDRLIVLSAGFRQLIEPMLEHAGFGGELTLVANDVQFTPDGGVVTWRDLPVCDLCGEECKRGDVTRLRADHPGREVVYIGDGFSDRCGAEHADRIFARASLAAYLDDLGVMYEHFDDFHSITQSLAERSAP
jgi:2-hydroxy-3-keto-5-methylthiopentenyl-1-phosphate phosphatase